MAHTPDHCPSCGVDLARAKVARAIVQDFCNLLLTEMRYQIADDAPSHVKLKHAMEKAVMARLDTLPPKKKGR